MHLIAVPLFYKSCVSFFCGRNAVTSQNQSNYTVLPFPKMRKQIIDGMRLASRKHMIHFLLEADVTKCRRDIREYRGRTGEGMSLTAFIIACLGKVVSEDTYLHAYRNWRNQLILFDDVDISTMIEVGIGDQKFPLDYIIRSANNKTALDIHQEIKAVQEKPQDSQKFKTMQWFLLLPAFARDICYWITSKNPHLVKKNCGTVAFTAVTMFMKGGFWGLGNPLNTLNVALGGMKECPVIVDGRIEQREYLCITVSVDHDIVDGAPAIRFIKRLKKLIEGGLDVS